ncbi:MAG TPA: Asp-tRNA(Asn)/Glu-tRNA(Gln) amidotransferase subunit GatC [Marinospirillum sp.]|uniref:Asp-tRNA(Asn)/Glu-tRNA(Gln) amidotransferase subunit GatC n=1 Tax=Marinospirillum sp. TaxID=2183934 RepID=UPI002B48A9EF|nr:Asp-tRNA(Asn)/Glu-tRNA(Gln) amidotransferase subunit GatC [Marinospirillum sp.]HKM14329.1 Asp-tRNA(Asn)/Glu-tRNA(Gln) amidotransferase subunit GatC [Marinospirillum sp.]
MKLNVEELHKVAHLARLSIHAKDEESYSQALSNILNLVDEMQSIDTHGVQPMAHPMDAVQRLRTDQVTENNQRDYLQQLAPATENGLYLVPRVVE